MSSYPRPAIKAVNLRRVTPETKFYIDYSWWEASDLDLKTYLLTRLSFSSDMAAEINAERVDLVDSRTGEVRQVDSFQYLVQSYFGRQGSDFAGQGSIVDAVFSVLLANGNEPLTAAEIAERVQKPTDLVVRTFGGAKIYHGIRPVFDED